MSHDRPFNYRGRHRKLRYLLVLTALAVSAPTGAETTISLVDAVEQTLRQNPAIRVQRTQVDFSEGELQAARGQFDPVLSLAGERAREQTPSPTWVGYSESEAHRTALSLGVTKQTRSGIVLGPEVALSRTEEKYDGMSPGEPGNLASISFAVTVPLLQGRGSQAVAAGEAVAERQLRAARFDFGHTVADSMLQTLSLYWNYLYAQRSLQVVRDTEARVVQLERQITRLVEADELPRAQLSLVRANLAEKIAQRVAAEQAVLAAKQQLGRALGHDYRASLALGMPADDFPPFSEFLLERARSVEFLVDEGMERRLDVRALRLRQEAAARAFAAARSNTRPQLDVSLRVGYGGLYEGDASGAYGRAFDDLDTGPSFTATLTYRQALYNNAARGALMQQSAIYDQSLIQLRTLTDDIGSGIVTAASQLLQSAAQLEESERSAALYREAVDNEALRHRLGTATLIDVINVQDRYAAALLNGLENRLNYANALVRLLYETGSLVTPSADGAEGYAVFLDPFRGH